MNEGEDIMMKELVSSGSPYEVQIGFSRALRVGNIISVSGTAPIGPDGKTVGPGNPATQTQRCLEIIRDALEDAGSSLSDVVRTRVYLTDINHWEEVGKVHCQFFRDVRPASTMLEVSRLVDPAWLIEIEADAIVDAAAS